MVDGPVRRRGFLKTLGFAAPAVFVGRAACSGQIGGSGSLTAKRGNEPELAADLIIIGGGLGACSTALAAARNGLRVIMTEETDWIGGQLTTQAVPPDENPWIESFGGTRSYLNLRQRIRDYYLRNFPLTPEARAKPFLNPGNGWVSRLCHEPRVSLAELQELFAPLVSGGLVTILTRHQATKASVTTDLVEAVHVRSLESGHDTALLARYFVDATELGDLLPLTGTEYVTGAESQKETEEPHAPAKADPKNMQAFTCCFAMDYRPGEDHTIEKPEDYSFWREFTPLLHPPWPGRLFSWDYCDPVTLKTKHVETDPEKGLGLWSYRRIADKSQFSPGTYRGDISLVNWPQNDYLLGNICEVAPEEAARHLAAAKQLSLSLLYWLQTEAPRPDGGTGWKGLRLRPDIVGSEDGLAKYPYIRESRRIRAEFTVLEQHVSTDFLAQKYKRSRDEVVAEHFHDSVGIGSYRIDLHPSTTGRNYLDISSVPFEIPLGALVPRRIENLLPACKNIGVTHITNGCYRLHPVEWNIGEAVGTLVAFCTRQKTTPRGVRKSPESLHDFQNLLMQQGVPLGWPKVTPR